MTPNASAHRAVANDVDFRNRAARGSGGTDCYAAFVRFAASVFSYFKITVSGESVDRREDIFDRPCCISNRSECCIE